MIIETFTSTETGFTSHVCMMRMNSEIYFTVDIYDTVEKRFLEIVKVFKPEEKQKALNFAKDAVGA